MGGRALAAALIAFHGAICLAGFFAPYDPAAQNRGLPYAPPARIHLFPRGRPFGYAVVCGKDAGGCAEDTSRAYPVRFFVAGTAYRLLGVFPNHLHFFGVDEPARIFLFGADDLGRDRFSRFLYGGQISLLAGLLAAMLSLALGLALGAAAGYWGGWRDEAIQRGADIFLALPWIYLLFAVRAFLPLSLDPEQAFLALVLVIGAAGWARPGRLIRGVVLSAKESAYVETARGFGAGGFYLLRRHILPETYGVALTQAALLLPRYILAEITLSFLGLGVGEPAASWGNLLSPLRQVQVLSAYPWMGWPLAILAPLFLGYSLFADEVQARYGSRTLSPGKRTPAMRGWTTIQE